MGSLAEPFWRLPGGEKKWQLCLTEAWVSSDILVFVAPREMNGTYLALMIMLNSGYIVYHCSLKVEPGLQVPS